MKLLGVTASNHVVIPTGIFFGAGLGSGGDDGSAGTTVTVTTTATVPAGGFLVFAATGYFPTTVTGSGGGLTWVTDSKHVNLGDSNQYISILSAQAPAGLASSTVLTFTYSGDTYAKLAFGCYFTGIATSSAKDAHAGDNSAAGTTWASASVTTSNADDVIVGVGWLSNIQSSSTAGTGYIEAVDYTNVTANSTYSIVYQIVAATGAYTPGGTWAASNAWVAGGVAYKAAA